MSLLTQKIIQKAVDKAIAKEAGREKAKTAESQADTYYNGIYMFGMDTYAIFVVLVSFFIPMNILKFSKKMALNAPHRLLLA